MQSVHFLRRNLIHNKTHAQNYLELKNSTSKEATKQIYKAIEIVYTKWE